MYYPASITKILTALIVIEHCDLDDIVTFSHDAIYNVEQGSSSAGMDVGDKMTVRDCLYAMLLKSANEVANALAEHSGFCAELCGADECQGEGAGLPGEPFHQSQRLK